MNFIDDVIQRFPFSREAVIAIDSEGRRKVHHFSHLFARSLGLSGVMLANGVRRGDVVLILVGSRIEWVISMLACFRMGAVALPVDPQLAPADLAHRVNETNPALAVGEAEFLARMPGGITCLDMDDLARAFDEDLEQPTPSRAERLDGGDPALIEFTSGSTGEMRGVIHPQNYLTGQSLQAEYWLGARPGDLTWCTTAPGWSMSSRNAFIGPWLCGAKALLVDGRFDPESRLEIARREKVNLLCQAATEYRMLVGRSGLGQLPDMRRMVSAGEAPEPEVIAAFREATGIGIAAGYGQTETGAVAGMRPDDPATGREGSIGRPLPGIETRIVNGELQLRAASSPTFFSRYLDGERFEGEWWPTGDLMDEDENGFLYLQGRIEEVNSPAAAG